MHPSSHSCNLSINCGEEDADDHLRRGAMEGSV
jgi:hypothetical protein